MKARAQKHMAAFGIVRTPPSASRLPPAPQEATRTNEVWVSLSVATVLFLAATTIALWPAGQDTKTEHKIEAPALPIKATLPSAPAKTELSEVAHLPTLFANPFDPSEVFEFPPGTSKDTARESVAEMLLSRARERGIPVSPVKRVHDHRSTPIPAPTLLSESLFKKVT